MFGGVDAGLNAAAGSADNTIYGYHSGRLMTTAQGVIAFGDRSLRDNIADRNHAFGHYAAHQVTTALEITAIGDTTLGAYTTGGTGSTALGFLAGYEMTAGNYNTWLGGRAGYVSYGQTNNVSYCIGLGYGAVTTANNQFVAGSNGSHISDFAIGYGPENTSGFMGTTVMRPTHVAAGIEDQANAYHLVLAGGKGTGTGVGSNVYIQTAGAGSAGSAQNSYTTRMTFTGSGNIGMFTDANFGAGVGVMSMANATTNPSANPTNAIVLYVDAADGLLKYRDELGNIITC